MKGEVIVAKNLDIVLLADYYGEMLTDNQRKFIEYYYNDDLSLSEIAENEGITRQGVRDAIKRAEAQLFDMEEKLVAEGKGESLCLKVTEPELWSPETPYLYKLICKLSYRGEIVDTFTSSVGLRDIKWVADKGMFLNGEHYCVKGICCHQDHAGLGAGVACTVCASDGCDCVRFPH